MVVVGGITRLTQSGLSMVDWNLVMGSVPPLNEQDWQEVFRQYQQSPEFRLKNYNFTLDEFKSIFWWEYIHRLIGRLIGIVFIIPFIYFLTRRRLSGTMIRQLIAVFFLGALQGFMGWYVVKSGLVDRPEVSHYRLAAHLVLAVVLFGYLLWILLRYSIPEVRPVKSNWIWRSSLILLFLTGLQTVYGAFVSGLKAGKVYNTFPKMGDEWIAESIGFALQKDGMISLFENLATVQFVHRYIGIVIFLLILVIWQFARRLDLGQHLRLALNLVFIVILIQFTLGVLTLLFAVPVTLGVLHQCGALFLISALIYQLFQSGDIIGT